MAFLRKKTFDDREYWYLVLSYRSAGKVKQAQAYLGPANMSKRELAAAKDRKLAALCLRVERAKRGKGKAGKK